MAFALQESLLAADQASRPSEAVEAMEAAGAAAHAACMSRPEADRTPVDATDEVAAMLQEESSDEEQDSAAEGEAGAAAFPGNH